MAVKDAAEVNGTYLSSFLPQMSQGYAEKNVFCVQHSAVSLLIQSPLKSVPFAAEVTDPYTCFFFIAKRLECLL